MTDLSNLRTASLYINNQLLSRGLLRDGHAINFADPSGRQSKSAADDAIDNTADTMSRIISVVNDLILRRDRDAEHRESLSTALRTVRAEHLRQANDLQRALERHAEAQRRADIGDAAEASLRAQLTAAEAANRTLREDAAKMRQLVSQTRASCANEVRKRDRQIDGLKKAVADAGRARGERRNPAIMTITVGGGDQQQSSRSNFVSPRSAQDTPRSHKSAAATAAAPPATTANSDYDLRSETNAFLAELARGLSEDNEVLLGLVHHTNHELKTMSGFGADDTDNDEQAPAAAASGNGNDYSALARDMEAVLDHLRTILTNPSFVPIEEVVQRESEIGRLRDGWEKMEDRWKEAVHLLDGWRQRMADSGRSVNMEEIKMGLRLSPVRVRHVAETHQSRGRRLPPVHEALDEVQEEEEEEYDGQDDAQEYTSSRRSPSPAESLRLVPAPRDPRYAENAGDVELSDSESDASSVFSDDDGPNVQIIEQSALMPSLEPSPAPEAFSRSTPSPSPPPPQKPALSKVTAAVLEETVEAADAADAAEKPRAQKDSDTAEKDKISHRLSPRKDKTTGKAALKPSRTAGNRGGTNGPTSAAAPTAPETKKDAPSAGVRGRRRPGEGEPSTVRPTARPAGPRAATYGATRTDSKRTTARRPVTSAATGPRPAKLAVHTKATAKATAKVAATAAASHDSEGYSSGVTSAASARISPRRKLHKQQQPSNEKPASKTVTAAPSPTSASDHMPLPPAPAAPVHSATTGASRARSRSPLKIATSDSTSRLPLPSTAAPPASPALNMATIAAKLAASEREADAARVRAKLKAMRSGLAADTKAKAKAKGLQPASASASSSMASVQTVSGGSEAIASSSTSTLTEIDSVDPVKKAVAPVDADHALRTSVDSNKSPGDDQDQADLLLLPRRKRDKKDKRRTSRVASRRRSTLNSWELKTLISGGADSEAADDAR